MSETDMANILATIIGMVASGLIGYIVMLAICHKERNDKND